MFSGSKNPKNILFDFEKGSTDQNKHVQQSGYDL